VITADREKTTALSHGSDNGCDQSGGESHWNSHARQWQWIASPLRPAPEDIQEYLRLIGNWAPAKNNVALRALLLGVTPEIAMMNWPVDTELLACDHSAAMIRNIWPGANPGVAATALCADWCSVPLPDRSRDIVIGDGCLNVLSSPDGVRLFMGSVSRIIRPGGLFLLRIFCRPLVPETISEVVVALHGGEIANPHILKWRLAMSLHGDIEQGVKLADIWDAWYRNIPAPETLARMTGWPREAIATIDAYRGVDTRYIFPTLGEALKAFGPDFEVVETVLPSYELGERCPIVALCRREQT
jgi:SAM-dependent methyltransferase